MSATVTDIESAKPEVQKTTPKIQKYEPPIPLDENIFTPTGLKIDVSGMAFEEWERLGDNLYTMLEGHQWWIGDWMKEGEKEFQEKVYGSVALDRFADTTVENYMRVAIKIPRSRRRKQLSFSHHQAVAAIKSREELDGALQWAIDNGKDGLPASVADLKAHVATIRAGEKGVDGPAPEPKAKTEHTYRTSFSISAAFESVGDQIWADVIEFMEKRIADEGLEARFENAKS